MASKSKAKASGADPNEPKPFLAKLYQMIDDPITAHVVSWDQSGEGLVINEVEVRTPLAPPGMPRNENLGIPRIAVVAQKVSPPKRRLYL